MARDIYPELGAAVREARERIGITQSELGIRVGLSRTSITNIERGRQVVLVHQLLELSAALDVAAAALLPTTSAHMEGERRAETHADLSALIVGLANYEPLP